MRCGDVDGQGLPPFVLLAPADVVRTVGETSVRIHILRCQSRGRAATQGMPWLGSIIDQAEQGRTTPSPGTCLSSTSLGNFDGESDVWKSCRREGETAASTANDSYGASTVSAVSALASLPRLSLTMESFRCRSRSYPISWRLLLGTMSGRLRARESSAGKAFLLPRFACEGVHATCVLRCLGQLLHSCRKSGQLLQPLSLPDHGTMHDEIRASLSVAF